VTSRATEILKARIPARAKAAIRKPRHLAGEMTAGARALPDFIIIGGQRCGTSSLYDYLRKHPRVVGPAIKEVHYFDLNFHKRPSWYRAYFPTRHYRQLVQRRTGGDLLAGEASPYYLFHPAVPARVAELIPTVKLIALLRDPVQRAASHHRLEVTIREERLSFEEAIEREPAHLAREEERLAVDPGYRSHSHQHFSYLARGIYIDQLRRWHEHFGRDSLLVVRSEDLYERPSAVYVTVLEFLGLPPADLAAYPVHGSGTYPPIRDETRARLTEYFRPHNERLYEYLGRDLRWSA
jgi:hypothetical protein